MRAPGIAKDSRSLAPTVPRHPLMLQMPMMSAAENMGHFDLTSERSGTSAQFHRHGHNRWNRTQVAIPSHGLNRNVYVRRSSEETATSWQTKSSLLSKLSSPARKMARLLQRTLGSLAPFRAADNELCPICYNTLELAKCFKLDRCQGHYFCVECMAHFLSGRIAEGRVKDLRCPLYGQNGCSAVATEEELRALLDKESMKKYSRFMAQQCNPSLRECPKCLLLVAPSIDVNGQIIPEMMCKKRCITFCYYHSLQHVRRNCDEYGRDQANTDRLVEKFLQGRGKKCPTCGILTEKFSGCNQMTCSACHVNWCWVCGENVEGRHGWHYNPINPRACLQFDDSDDCSPEGNRSWLMVAMKICALPAMLASTCLFILACASTFLAPLFVVPLLVLMIAWVPVAVLIHCCFIPLGADERHINFLLCVPFTTFMAEVEMVSNLFSNCMSAEAADEPDLEVQI